MRVSIACASLTRCSPSPVKRTRRELRTTRLTPSACSSLLRRSDSAGGVTFNDRAAPLSEPVRASASMNCRSASEIIQFSLTELLV